MKRLLCFFLSLFVFVSATVVTYAVESPVQVICNDTSIDSTQIKIVYGVPYITADACLHAGSNKCDISQDGNVLQALGEFAQNQVYALYAKKGDKYVNVNGRYLYVPLTVMQIGGKIALPIYTYKQLFSGTLTKSPTGENTYYLQTGIVDLVFGSEFYDEEMVMWIARTIYSEAGNQSLEGKIAVGNVICNRVLSPDFPSNVYSVILADNQFDGIRTKYFNSEPPTSCCIAAKLALEGIEIFPNAIYFNTKGLNSWASRTRVYLGTLGGHDFYR